MNDAQAWDNPEFTQKLQEITIVIKDLAQEQQGDCQGLLLLLRTLEQLHREIREQLFEPSLPNTRKDVYSLLRDIEESGGWPYIERMRLKEIMNHFLTEESGHLQAQALKDEKQQTEPLTELD